MKPGKKPSRPWRLRFRVFDRVLSLILAALLVYNYTLPGAGMPSHLPAIIHTARETQSRSSGALDTVLASRGASLGQMSVPSTVQEAALHVDDNGVALAQFIESLDVTSKWDRGKHISWFGGRINNPKATRGNSTHCSAFISAICERLGVPMLRVPFHGQILLASAQHRWLEGPGQELGWRITTNLIELQAAANSGLLAVISKESLEATVAGHIVVVRPNAAPSIDWLLTNGPQIAHSGNVNTNNKTANLSFNLTATYVLFAIYERKRPVKLLNNIVYKATNTAEKLFFAVELAPAGRLIAHRFEYNPSGKPVWQLGAGGVGLENSDSVFTPWYSYKLNFTSNSEPFDYRKSGNASFILSSNSNAHTTSISAIIENNVNLPIAPDESTHSVNNVTGFWYASVDSKMYGIVLTYSNTTHVGGFALLYDVSGMNEFQQLALKWTQAGKMASGNLNRCYYANASDANPTCTTTASTVSLSLVGFKAEITGIPSVPAEYKYGLIEKATWTTPFLGPLI